MDSQYLKEVSNTLRDPFAYLMACLNSLPNQGGAFSFTLRADYSFSSSSLFVRSFDVYGFDTRLNAVKERQAFFFPSLSLLCPPHYCPHK